MTGPLLAFVISPQPWTGFHVSKHHYAIALAERGWRVVFIDPPQSLGRAGQIEVIATDVPGITNVRYQTVFPYKLKFRSRWLFDVLMRRQARRLVASVGKPDMVWDFDNAYQFRDLRSFGAATNLFHLVDDVGKSGMGIKGADHMFYLHPSFCTRAGGIPDADHEIGHGLGKMHEIAARQTGFGAPRFEAPRVGFVGNLAAAWIDWQAIETMLARHPEARFTFWGPLPEARGANPALARILGQHNAEFPGLTSPAQILAEAPAVDVWLVPFVTEKLPGGPLNSHKILEYLSTGKAVVMSWLEAYEGNALVDMVPSSGNVHLADLLDSVLANLIRVNEPQMMINRREFALEKTYDRHLRHILFLIETRRSVSSHAA